MLVLQTLGHGAVLRCERPAWKGAVQVPAVVQQEHRPSPAQLASCHTQSPLQAACHPPGCPQSAEEVELVYFCMYCKCQPLCIIFWTLRRGRFCARTPIQTWVRFPDHAWQTDAVCLQFHFREYLFLLFFMFGREGCSSHNCNDSNLRSK